MAAAPCRQASPIGRPEPAAGSATVELAAAIPLLVAITLAMVGLLGLARDHVLAQGAAREAAREAAVGGGEPRASAAARAALPPGRPATITVVAAEPDRVRVSVELPVGLPFGARPLVIKAVAAPPANPDHPHPRPMSPTALVVAVASGGCGTVGEKGGATLVGLALAGFVLMAGLVAVDVGALVGARAAAQTAADLAALAALSPQTGPVAGSAQSCEARAAGIAAANGAELVACECSGVEAVVRVRRRLRLVPGGLSVSVGASARAVLARPAASRATVRAVDLLRVADGDLAERLGGVTEGEGAGRPARQRERGGRGGAVRGLGGGGPGRSATCRRSASRSSGSGWAGCCWRGSCWWSRRGASRPGGSGCRGSRCWGSCCSCCSR